MFCSSAPDLGEGPAVDDPNCLVRWRMIRWTLRCPHYRHHLSPNPSRDPDGLMKSGILVIRNMTHEGRLLEGKQMMNNEDRLLSCLQVLSLGVLLDSPVNIDSTPGWV